jgi:hypothetical protein
MLNVRLFDIFQELCAFVPLCLFFRVAALPAPSDDWGGRLINSAF